MFVRSPHSLDWHEGAKLMFHKLCRITRTCSAHRTESASTMGHVAGRRFLRATVVHTSTRFCENRLKTFRVILLTDKLMDGHWRKHKLLGGVRLLSSARPTVHVGPTQANTLLSCSVNEVLFKAKPLFVVCWDGVSANRRHEIWYDRHCWSEPRTLWSLR